MVSLTQLQNVAFSGILQPKGCAAVIADALRMNRDAEGQVMLSMPLGMLAPAGSVARARRNLHQDGPNTKTGCGFCSRITSGSCVGRLSVGP